jgi:hypothetical protein
MRQEFEGEAAALEESRGLERLVVKAVDDAVKSKLRDDGIHRGWDHLEKGRNGGRVLVSGEEEGARFVNTGAGLITKQLEALHEFVG